MCSAAVLLRFVGERGVNGVSSCQPQTVRHDAPEGRLRALAATMAVFNEEEQVLFRCAGSHKRMLSGPVSHSI